MVINWFQDSFETARVFKSYVKDGLVFLFAEILMISCSYCFALQLGLFKLVRLKPNPFLSWLLKIGRSARKSIQFLWFTNNIGSTLMHIAISCWFTTAYGYNGNSLIIKGWCSLTCNVQLFQLAMSSSSNWLFFKFTFCALLLFQIFKISQCSLRSLLPIWAQNAVEFGVCVLHNAHKIFSLLKNLNICSNAAVSGLIPCPRVSGEFELRARTKVFFNTLWHWIWKTSCFAVLCSSIPKVIGVHLHIGKLLDWYPGQGIRVFHYNSWGIWT